MPIFLCFALIVLSLKAFANPTYQVPRVDVSFVSIDGVPIAGLTGEVNIANRGRHHLDYATDVRVRFLTDATGKVVLPAQLATDLIHSSGKKFRKPLLSIWIYDVGTPFQFSSNYTMETTLQCAALTTNILYHYPWATEWSCSGTTLPGGQVNEWEGDSAIQRAARSGVRCTPGLTALEIQERVATDLKSCLRVAHGEEAYFHRSILEQGIMSINPTDYVRP